MRGWSGSVAAGLLLLTWLGLAGTALGEVDSSYCPKTKSLATKIVGGEPAGIGEFPYMVSLRFNKYYWRRSRRGLHFCGGALIAKNVVLTAAHCLSNDKSPAVHIGRYERTGGDGGRFETFQTKEHRMHEWFESPGRGRHKYDIALIVLDGNSQVEPVALAEDESCFTKYSACQFGTVIGWGLTNYNDRSSQSVKLLKVEVPLVPRDECKQKFGGGDIITDSMVCAGERGKDACLNDSGGPLLVGEHPCLLGGIVSWGDGCGGDRPGVYASVIKAKDWIKRNLEQIEGTGSAPPPPPPPPPQRPKCMFFLGKYFPKGCDKWDR